MVWGSGGNLTTLDALTDDSVVVAARFTGKRKDFRTTSVSVKSRFMDDGFKITTKRGYTTEGTKDHPVWACPPQPKGWHNGQGPDRAKRQWMNLADLPVGWFVEMAYGPWVGWQGEIDEDAYFHGLMRGDGCEMYPYGVMKLTGHIEETLLPWTETYLDARQISHRTYQRSENGVSLEWCNLPFKQEYVGWEPTWDARTTASYIRGLFDAEGCVTDHSFVLVNTEIDLVRWIHIALLSFGIRSTFRVYAPNDKHKRPSPTARLSISGFSCKRYMKSIGFGESEKARKGSAIADGRRSEPAGKFWMDRVTGKEPIHDREFVGISTGTETYIGDGFLSHNSGKTQDGAAEAIHWLSGHSPYRPIPKGPLTGIISGESFEVLRNSVVEKLLELCPKNGSFKLTWTRDEHRMEGPNGVAIFKSAEQGWQAYQAIALDWGWMDEEQNYEIFKQMSKRLKRDSILQMWFTMTAEPDKPDHWTYEHLAVKALEGRSVAENGDVVRAYDVAHFEFDLEDNRKSRGGFIDDSEIDALIDMTPVDDRPAVIHGKYVKRGGLVYPMWSRQHHVTASVPLKQWLEGVKNGTYTAFCALDWGVRNPTSIGLYLEDKDENVHRIDEIYHPAESTTQIKQEYKQKFAPFQPVFVVSDPSIWNNHDSVDPSRTIAGQLMEDDPVLGLPGLPLIPADNDITNGLAAVRELLSVHPTKGPKLKVQDRCVNFIREIENYTGEEYVNAPYLKNKKETPRKKGDHSQDECRYFAMSAHGHIPKYIPMDPHYEYSEAGFMRVAV